MPTYYIDEAGDERVFVYAALRVPAQTHDACENALQAFRQSLWASDGVPVGYELHATQWIGGRGRPGGKIIAKGRRAEIFRDALKSVAALPGVAVLGVVASGTADGLATIRLLQTLDARASAEDMPARLIADNGREGTWQRAQRRVLPAHLEPVVFEDSAASLFLQMADFAAYALLRHESPSARGVQTGWEGLDAVSHVLRIVPDSKKEAA